MYESHPLHVWHHMQFIWHHFHSFWPHTIVCMSWHTLCLWHHMHYIWHHPYCFYDYQSSISDLKTVKTSISSTLYVITASLSNPSHLLCKTSQEAYVCHHMHYTWHNIHTLWQQPLLFMTSQALYSLHHTHYIWHLIYSVWCHIHYVCSSHNDSMSSNTICLWHIHLIWHHAQCYDHTTLCAFTPTMPDITLCVFLTLHTLYQFYEMVWIYVITASISMTPYALHMTSHPLFMTSHHFIYDVSSTISNLTSTLSDLVATVSV